MEQEAQRKPASMVAAYSGGLDSTTLLYAALDEGIDLRGALSVDYGQKHGKELGIAASLAKELGVPHRSIDLRSMVGLFGGSGLTHPGAPIPEGHYEEAAMKVTVVPNRNMILLSLGAAWAIAEGADAVAYGAHRGDHAIYPDCREAFARAMDQAMGLCDWRPLFLYRPFVGLTKADVVRLGHRLGAPLGRTWSCYKGQERHCGRCATCIERREAFYLAELDDPTEYDPEAPETAALAAQGWKLER